MSKLQDFGETQNVAITVLVDNRADLITQSTDTVKRFTDEPLLAEHGFAALVDLKDAGTRILWDAGLTSTAMMDNMKRMALDPATLIDKIAISHGHGDHTAAVADVLEAIGVQPDAKEWPKETPVEEMINAAQLHRVPLVIHPAAFRECWGVAEDGRKYGPMFGPPRALWAALGADVILSEGPYQLGPGCWTTGEVPRRSFETSGIPTRVFYRQGTELLPHRIEDDQAIVIHVRDKGLVVLSGCAHSGIVNTVNYAREISGVDDVWAILGGFHLARATDEDIQRTIDEIKAIGPKVIVPSHCTGFKAIAQFAAQMPDAFVLGLVGTTYLF